MIKKWIVRSIAFITIILAAACSLPEITPPVATAAQTEQTSFVPATSEITEVTSSPTSNPVEISARNAGSLEVVNRSAVSNIQQFKWANDGLSLVVSTQNSDSTGTQLFGAAVLSIPDLSPMSIYSNQNERVSDIASNGKLTAVVSLDMTSFSIIDLSNSNAVVIKKDPGFLIGNVSFSPDSTIIAVSNMEAWEVVLFSVSDGTQIRSLTGFETAAPVYQAGFKGSPQWMVWLARATLQLQEIESGKFSSPLHHQDFVTAYALTNDGSIIASAAPKYINEVMVSTVTLWDAAGGVELKTFELDNMAQCLAFSPNSNLLAIGVGSALQIWDVTSGTLVISLDQHGDQINNLAFSPDGKYIATAGLDNQLYLWQTSE